MVNFVRAVLSRLWRKSTGPAVVNKRQIRPALECLENRWVPSNNGAISGHVFIDPTGNGLQATVNSPEKIPTPSVAGVVVEPA